MGKKKKRAEKHNELTEAAKQRKTEPPAVERLSLVGSPNHRNRLAPNEFHAPGTLEREHPDQYRPVLAMRAGPVTRASVFSATRETPNQYRPRQGTTAVSHAWNSVELPVREIPYQYRSDLSTRGSSETGYSEAWAARQASDCYRPSESSRASRDVSNPSASVVRESRSITTDHGLGNTFFGSRAQIMDSGYVPTPRQNGLDAISIPRPSRTGTIDLRQSGQTNGREVESIPPRSSFTSINNTSSIWQPNPTIPSFTTLSTSPLGAQRNPQIQPANVFTAYEQLRLVRTIPEVSPWRVNKIYMFRNYKSNAKALPIPMPTTQYFRQAGQHPRKSDILRPLLLVVDLNGTLISRNRAKGTFVERPNLASFLEYVLENHTLMIWSSARPENVAKVCQRLFSKTQRRKVIGEWARDTLDLADWEYREKVQVYKRLDKIWKDKRIRYFHPDAESGGEWDQSNTVLIDDSKTKAATQPHNLLEVPEFTNSPEQRNTDVLKQVTAYLEELRWQEDVSAFIRARSFGSDDGCVATVAKEAVVQT
ncbi:hypothetical protein MMC16_000627 [Acarospora aff. strigata]|nr:hypothetical protein [Acarospora aff. strigata]